MVGDAITLSKLYELLATALIGPTVKHCASPDRPSSPRAMTERSRLGPNPAHVLCLHCAPLSYSDRESGPPAGPGRTLDIQQGA